MTARNQQPKNGIFCPVCHKIHDVAPSTTTAPAAGYIITEEDLMAILEPGSGYPNERFWIRRDIALKVRSRPYTLAPDPLSKEGLTVSALCGYESGFEEGFEIGKAQCEMYHEEIRQQAATDARKDERERVLGIMRPEVLLFALSMEQKLRKHDKDRGKEGWHFDGEASEGREYLVRRLDDEVKELKESMDDCPPFGSFYWEAIDVGNFAMMISYFDHTANVVDMITERLESLRQRKGGTE